MVKLFKQKPIVVEAEQFFKDRKPWPNGVIKEDNKLKPTIFFLLIDNKRIYVDDRDWIVKEKDEYYVLTPKLFELRYVAV